MNHSGGTFFGWQNIQQETHWSDLMKVEDVMRAHPGLVQELKRYSFESAIPLVGSLLTMPQFHANTIRLEALVHLACVACSGKREADREMLVRCAGRHLEDSPLCRMEDPVEDVFIGNVATHVGNFRVFRGIQESGDFWLESSLQPFALAQVPPAVQKVFESVTALLTLSDVAVARLGHSRYTSGSGIPGHRLAMPQWREITLAQAALTFSTNDLKQLGIAEEQLSPFILSSKERPNVATQQIGHTELERCPVVGYDGDLVLALPHAVVPSAERHLITGLETSGFLPQFARMLHLQQADRWFRTLRHGLDFEPYNLELPKPPDGLPPIYQKVMTFDVGKYAHVLMLDGNLGGHKIDANAVDELTDEQAASWNRHLGECIKAIKQQPGFNGGMTLISRGGFGRAFAIPMEKLEAWGVIVAPLPDWETLARCEDASALRLWRMWRQQAWAESQGLTITNPSGFLNLFAFWRANDWRFLIRDMPLKHPHKMIVAPTDMLKEVREEVRRSYDFHSSPPHTGVGPWLLVERRSAKAYFAKEKSSPVYIAPTVTRQNELLAVIQSARRNWWVSCIAHAKPGEERSIVFQLWDCLLQWVERAAPFAEQAFASLPQESIQVELDVRDLNTWTEEKLKADEAPKEPELFVDKEKRILRITLHGAFKREFHVPENRAEQALAKCFLAGCAVLADSALTDALSAELLAKVFPNAHARYFHFVVTQNLAQILAPSGRPDPEFIAEEDCSQSLIGLADEIGELPHGGKVQGQNECLEYLQKATDKLWERIESKLQDFHRGEVVMRCFKALAELERDAERWNMTARAMLNLHQDAEEVMQVAGKRRSKNDAATLMNRLLIETAMYASPVSGDRALPQAEHLEILANLQNLVATANHRDAISTGFMPPEIHVFPNGELDVDDDFYRSVMLPYVSAMAAGAYQESASQYESWFLDSVKEANLETEDALRRLEQPFTEEFGFSPQQLVVAAHNFGRFAREKSAIVLEFGEKEFLAFLQSRCAFNATEAEAYLRALSLPPRRAWNKDLPDGMNEREVFPWRFRRRMSLLMRPLVLLSAMPEKRWLVYPPLIEKCGAYLLYNLAEANFPTEHFRTNAMIAFWGAEANRQGHKFASEVSVTLQSIGWSVRQEVKMSSLGVPANEGDLGDLDVIAWRTNSPLVLLIECKRLRRAISVRDVVERLDEYRGIRDDSLGKHNRRVEWILNNPSSLSAMTGIAIHSLKFTRLLVSSDLVPMQFFAGAPIAPEQVVPLKQLPESLKGAP